ncbi:hypothetical protein [Herbaspirillum chlorophenolicum]|uniref:hypothetical protein n=1 Tax=Herbaspirillum chlorophenolicum TaxID=211589 RepID=UPI00067BAFB5|nr:hypothetical protein [Herbaspirillum chlorophenolicum]
MKSVSAWLQVSSIPEMRKIIYTLLVPGSLQKVTPFQGFNHDVATPEFLSLVEIVSILPNDARELFLNHTQLVEYRRLGATKSVWAMGAQNVSLELFDEPAIHVIAVPQKHIAKALKIRSKVKSPLIILSTKSGEGIVNLRERNSLDPTFLDAELLEILKETAPIPADQLPLLRSSYNVPLELKSRINGTVRANEFKLLSLGFTFSDSKAISPLNDQNYFDAVNDILTVTKRVAYEDEAIPQLVMFSPAIAAHLYDVSSPYWNGILKLVKSQDFRSIIKDGFIRNRGYAGFKILWNGSAPDKASEQVTGFIMHTRQREQFATVASIALLCSSGNYVPLRLPHEVNLHRGLLDDIERFRRRTDRKAAPMLQERFRSLSENLTRAAIQFQDTITTSSRITICSDVPLEWIVFNDLPLMISHEVSRIPITTGNMLMQYAAVGDSVAIPAAALHKVLVIRSFKQNDPIRNALQTAIETFRVSDTMEIIYADVANKDELVAALNGFDGLIVVFDCHGQHGGHRDSGWLQIGDDKIDTWQLFGRARIPPIAFLSACSTPTISWSHASVSNGLLRSGAFTVVGTFLDVDAFKASAFIARILDRIHSCLPALRNLGFKTVNWRMLISVFLRMSYASDILEFFNGIELISNEERHDMGIAANLEINSLDPDWHTNLIGKIARSARMSSGEILERIRKDAALVETMLYCQHGRPELIDILLDELDHGIAERHVYASPGCRQ